MTIALGAIPEHDWRRTWAPSRTILLTMTSKTLKEVVEKMRLPVVVQGKANVFYDLRVVHRKTREEIHEHLQFVLRQLAAMTDRWHVVSLSLPKFFDFSRNVMGLAQAQSLAAVLGQCPALAHLDLSRNDIGQDGTEILADVLGQCTALAHLNLSDNDISSAGTETLLGVTVECCRIAQPSYTSISAKIQI